MNECVVKEGLERDVRSSHLFLSIIYHIVVVIPSSSDHQSIRLYAHDSMRTNILFWLDIQQFSLDLLTHTMASRPKRRTPHNIYTEKRAEQEFQDFVQHARLRNLPIPGNLLAQATDDNRPSSPKRQRLTLQKVRQRFFSY